MEGIAAGAMLTMTARTMAPEAYLKAGPVVGMPALMGFLAAVFFKALEQPRLRGDGERKSMRTSRADVCRRFTAAGAHRLGAPCAFPAACANLSYSASSNSCCSSVSGFHIRRGSSRMSPP